MRRSAVPPHNWCTEARSPCMSKTAMFETAIAGSLPKPAWLAELPDSNPTPARR